MDYQTKKDYDALLNEWFDLSDIDNLHLITNLDEAGQNQLLVSLTDKLYQKIVEKIDDIDFGTIPKSAGDITKIENYDSMIECLEIIRDIVKQYGQKEEPVDTILTAIGNIKDRKDLFMKCFAMNIELGIIMYNSMVLACVSSVSYMIATSIGFIKSPTDETFEVSLDKVAYQKTMNAMLYNDLRKWNIACKNHEVDKTLKAITEGVTKKLSGEIMAAAVLAPIVAIPLMKTILPMIQDVVYLFYYSTQSVSDYWSTQADLLQMSRSTVVYRQDIPESKKKDILRKQDKAVQNMRKISNFFAIDIKKAEKSAENTKTSEKKKYKAKPKTLDNMETVGDMDAAFDSNEPLF